MRIAGYFGYPDCVEKVFQCASDADENVRKAAVEHLPYIEDRRVITILGHWLRHGTPAIRAAAALRVWTDGRRRRGGAFDRCSR